MEKGGGTHLDDHLLLHYENSSLTCTSNLAPPPPCLNESSAKSVQGSASVDYVSDRFYEQGFNFPDAGPVIASFGAPPTVDPSLSLSWYTGGHNAACLAGSSRSASHHRVLDLFPDHFNSKKRKADDEEWERHLSGQASAKTTVNDILFKGLNYFVGAMVEPCDASMDIDLSLSLSCNSHNNNVGMATSSAPNVTDYLAKKHRHETDKGASSSESSPASHHTKHQFTGVTTQGDGGRWVIKKRLTKTDVGSASRLIIAKGDMDSHILPCLTEEQKQLLENNKGINLDVWDSDTKSKHPLHFMKLSSNKNMSYVLNKHWKQEFVNRRDLRCGDLIGLYWDSPYSRLTFSVLQRATAAGVDDGDTGTGAPDARTIWFWL